MTVRPAPGRMSPPSPLPSLALIALSWIAVGCYRPSITDGGLMCAAVSPACPDGYTCLAGRCHRPSQGDAAGAPDTGGDRMVSPDASSDADGGGAKDASADRAGDAADAACVQRQAPAGCTPKAGLACDPVCQTGCCTSEKCTALNTGAEGSTRASLGCFALDAKRNLGETCDVLNAGTPARSDNCLAGLLCVSGDADAICLQLCRDDADCSGGARCEMRLVEPRSAYTAGVCGLPDTTCTPTTPATVGCPKGRTCYLVSPDKNAGDRTVCDITSGAKTNASCTYPFECLPGWTCPATGAGAGRCHPVCVHGAAAACPANLTCQADGRDYDLCL